MARGAYIQSPQLKGLRSLVGFAESERPAPALAAVADLGRLAAGVITRFRNMSPADVQAMRLELRAFLRSLTVDRDATMALAIAPTIHPLRVGKRVILLVDGAPTDVVFFLAASMLESVGTERLRLCRAPDCGRVFVKVGRREFCSGRCQRRVFLSTYDPFAARARRTDQQKKGTRHGKSTRKR